MSKSEVLVVIPNWDGLDFLHSCLSTLNNQTIPVDVAVVDNGSTDGSVAYLSKQPLKLIKNKKNMGFTGGVNPGIKYGLKKGYKYIALLNNDALPQKKWAETLLEYLENNHQAGIATSKMITDENKIDSAGEGYSIWGLPFPRARGAKRDVELSEDILGASGGASMYRSQLFEEIGLFDQDFFAYFEDVDISFRAQLAGWRVSYVADAVVKHKVGATSSKHKGLTTYHSFKNWPIIIFKDLPLSVFFRVIWRFLLIWPVFLIKAIFRGEGWPAIKGSIVSWWMVLKNLGERRKIQKSRKVPASYINSLISRDFPKQ